MSLLSILSSRKDFADPWVGNPTLNRYGLHGARIAVTDACLSIRRKQLTLLAKTEELAALVADGVLVLPDFLPAAEFAQLRDEAHRHVSAIEARVPVPRPERGGFGEQDHWPGGFDRFDGSMLNRFFAVDAASTPVCAAAIRAPRLARLCRVASGFRHSPHRFWLYQTVAGTAREQARWPDIQAVTHRDTFHSAIKLWLYIDDVADEHGPFMYLPGSHRLSPARSRWEKERALAASAPDSKATGGAFRASDDELAAMGLGPPRAYPAKANTLVIADVRGFHRRGEAEPGARRLALYANLRRWPFAPLPI